MLSKEDYRDAYARFCERLRQARQNAGLSQAQVALHLGRPQSFISKVESGERRLDFVELQVLARLYKCQLDYFEDEKLAR